MNLANSPPVVPTGKIKSFGAFGPKYAIGEPKHQLENGDWMIGILLVETGEETVYRYSHSL
ncbi:MAG: DUF5397 domain-containing protein [Magnetococcus sp. YQC-5]